MPKYSNIHQAISDNQRKECSTRGCRNNRNRIGAYCSRCRWYRWYWGHPEARSIKRKDYQYESEMAQHIIEKNSAHHEGIQHAIEFLNNYMERSANGATHLPGWKHAARLHDAGVTGKEILVELAAIYILSRNYHTPILDHRHLKYLLGNKFIIFRPCRERIRGTENRDIGEYLNENVGLMLLNINNAARKLEQKKEGKEGAAV